MLKIVVKLEMGSLEDRTLFLLLFWRLIRSPSWQHKRRKNVKEKKQKSHRMNKSIIAPYNLIEEKNIRVLIIH